MRQLKGVRSSKIYHCHLSEEAMEYCCKFVLRRAVFGGIESESEDGQGVGLTRL